MNEKAIKAIGIGATLIGIAATLASNWVGSKNQEATIKKEVAKAVAVAMPKNES